jgi:hypothetical protein
MATEHDGSRQTPITPWHTPFDSWLRLFSPTIKFPDNIRYPGGGDIGGFVYQPQTQWGAPSLSMGDAQTEYRVYSEVATPGKQLGKLTDAVLALAGMVEAMQREGDSEMPEAIAELKRMATSIEQVKTDAREIAERNARANLEKLACSDRERLKRLLDEYGHRLAE